MSTAPLIDLDASRREAQFPDGIPVKHKGVDYLLPAELPAEVLDPIVLLDLPGLLQKVLEERGSEDDDESMGQLVLDVLFDRPELPKDLLDAVKAVFAAVFDDQWETFVSNRPSIQDYVRLAQALMPLYGVSLGEALASPASSESAGETSKPTSPSSTASTPATSGRPRKKKATSGSAASAT